MGMAESTHVVSGDFELTMDELRVVVDYVVRHAEDVLPVFERVVPGDSRPRVAIGAAWVFVHGGRRTKLQRVASVEAHRAARSAPTETARLAARSAGDAASAAYLHPIAQASQVGHILRAAASVARIAELAAGDDPAIGEARLERSLRCATPVLIDVLRRYPPATGDAGNGGGSRSSSSGAGRSRSSSASSGNGSASRSSGSSSSSSSRNRVAQLMCTLDRDLRRAADRPPGSDTLSRTDARGTGGRS